MSKLSAFKVVSIIAVLSGMALSGAAGVVLGRNIVAANDKNVSRQDEKEQKNVKQVEKTKAFGYLDEYTITYEDDTISTFIVVEGPDGKPQASVFLASDGTLPKVVIGENGNWFVNGGDTGLLAQLPAGVQTPKDGQNGQDGVNGKSAYELAVAHGYAGTEEQWLASLIGEAGAAGVNGVNGKSAYELAVENGYTGTLEQWLASLVGETGAAGQNGENGTNGKSAYELAQENGFTGSLAEWLVSLVGPEGATGQNGTNGADGKSAYELAVDAGYQGTLEQWLASLVGEAGAAGQNGQDGANGKSAYEIAKDHGYTGTEEEWLTSLVGAQGAAGAAGQDGINGKSAYELAVDNGFTGSVVEWLNSLKGRSIVSILKTDTSGLVDTYTIIYSDNTSSIFTVTNGAQGIQGIQGEKGNDGVTPTIEINNEGYWVINGVTSNIKAEGVQGPAGTNGTNGTNGQDGKSVLTGNGAPDADLGVEGETYLDIENLNLYIKTSTGWGEPVANIKGSTGANGQDGQNGTDGTNGISVTSATINDAGHLIVTLSDNNEIDAGLIKEQIEKHTVTFDSAGGSEVAELENIIDGATIHAPTEPTKDNYIFQGWFTDDGAKWSFGKDQVTSDITLYAHWAQFRVVNGWLVQATATGDVTIPSEVDGQVIYNISPNAFADSIKPLITSIAVPYSITEIFERSFQSFTNLEEVYIPESITKIGPAAFRYCESLKSFVVPSRVNTIGAYAFQDCTSLEYIHFANQGKPLTIDGGAFINCSSLKSIILPKSTVSVSNTTFNGCDSLEYLSIPYIGFSPEYLSILSSIYQSDNPSLKTLEITGDYGVQSTTVSNCPSVENVIISGNPAKINTAAFYGTNVNVKKIVVPYIGRTPTESEPFYYFFGYSTSQINSSVESIEVTGDVDIPANTFKDCTYLKEIKYTGNPTSIGEAAFKNCSSLESFIIPDSVNTVTKGAFEGCTSLKSLTMKNIPMDSESTDPAYISYIFGGDSYSDNATYVPESLKSVTLTSDNDIPANAFKGCAYIEKMNLLGKPTKIGKSAFEGCSSLQLCNIPNTVTTLEESCFKDCLLLDNVFISNSITTIEMMAFYGCSSLQSIVIPNSVTSLGESCFRQCSALKTAYIGSGINDIPWGTFCLCRRLETVYLAGNAQTYGPGAFEGCYYLTNLNISDSLTTIESSTFRSCKKMTSFVAPSTLTSIGAQSFEDCISLMYVDLTAASGISLHGYAFEGCIALSTVKLGTSLANIDYCAFKDCKSLTEIDLSHVSINYTYNYGILQGCTSLETLVVKEFKKDMFRGTVPESLKTVIVVGLGDNSSYIPTEAFANCSHIETIICSFKPLSISQRAFSGCTSLKNLYIGDNHISIKEAAFKDCSSLESIDIYGTNIYSIEKSIFEGCTSLKTIRIPYVADSGLAYYFGGDSYEDNATLVPESLKTIVITNPRNVKEQSFSGCAHIENVTFLSEYDYSLGEKAFQGCTSLKSITVPNRVEVLSECFSGCTSLESVNLGTGVKKIYQKTFDGCIKLEKVTFTEQLKNIEQYAFNNCYSLYKITLPQTLLTIGDYAFYHCENLASIFIPNSVTTIGEGAFEGCYMLTTIRLHGQITTVGSDAFKDCYMLSSIVWDATQGTYSHDAAGYNQWATAVGMSSDLFAERINVRIIG